MIAHFKYTEVYFYAFMYYLCKANKANAKK